MAYYFAGKYSGNDWRVYVSVEYPKSNSAAGPSAWELSLEQKYKYTSRSTGITTVKYEWAEATELKAPKNDQNVVSSKVGEFYYSGKATDLDVQIRKKGGTYQKIAPEQGPDEFEKAILAQTPGQAYIDVIP